MFRCLQKTYNSLLLGVALIQFRLCSHMGLIATSLGCQWFVWDNQWCWKSWTPIFSPTTGEHRYKIKANTKRLHNTAPHLKHLITPLVPLSSNCICINRHFSHLDTKTSFSWHQLIQCLCCMPGYLKINFQLGSCF